MSWCNYIHIYSVKSPVICDYVRNFESYITILWLLLTQMSWNTCIYMFATFLLMLFTKSFQLLLILVTLQNVLFCYPSLQAHYNFMDELLVWSGYHSYSYPGMLIVNTILSASHIVVIYLSLSLGKNPVMHASEN